MELPQPRPIGTEGKKPTHDNFLSLYSHSSFTDPRSSQGNNGLKTHDFLQPLERVGKNNNTLVSEKTVDRTKNEKTTSPSSSSPPVERILPGGIGTYTISHISNINQGSGVPKTKQTIAIGSIIQARSTERSGETTTTTDKPNSSSNSINGSVFKFWDESNIKEKGKKVETHVSREQSEKLGQQWSSERPLQSSPFLHSNSFNSLSSSTKQIQKSQSSFLDMMKSGRGLQDDEDDDDEEFANSSKKSSSSQKDGKSGDPKANTPRSKHSATEQRRRSKINDRFQILRELIPQNDQKRDKASFLLEVIEYIQYLQEKVNRYDASYQGWSQEPMKLTPWRNGHAPGESLVDLKSGPGPAMMFPGKFEESIIANPTLQNPVDPSLGASVSYSPMDHHPEVSNRSGSSIPISLQPNMFTTSTPQSQQQEENIVSQSQWPLRPCTTDCPGTSENDHEDLAIEGGTINVEGVYSQGLLNNLTQALQSSGVDLTHATVSVQVDVGKRAISRLNAMTSGVKDDGNPSGHRTTAHSRVESSGEDSSGQARKRHRTE